MAAGKLVVCVPARNEAERLPQLLDALMQQTVNDVTVVVSLNNTCDRSRDAIDEFGFRHPASNIVVDDVTFHPDDAHAGSARRRAMDLAADLAGPRGYVLTTDADTRPPCEWLANNRAAMARGLDIVGGMIVIDDNEPLPDEVAAMHLRASSYWARVREIEDAIDPVAWDLPPRHGDHTGASLCMTVSAYRRCGGVPPLRSGEDRALVRAVLRGGGKLAHPISIWTRVSPRSEGRASGGMAEHMARLHCEIAKTDIMLPSFAQWRERAAWRRGVRTRGGTALVAELEDELPPMTNDMSLCDGVLEHA